MTITRDSDYPAEIAQLFQAFSQCSDGHTTHTVLEASANMLIAAIHLHVRQNDGDMDHACLLAAQIGRSLPDQVEEQWNRAPKPTDIEVTRGN